MRDSELEKVPYLLVIGDREFEGDSVSVRARGSCESRMSVCASGWTRFTRSHEPGQGPKTELANAVESFASEVESLDDERFLGPLGRWSARDIVAHLIGWNRYMVRGMEQILLGELPFYDVDPGEDFANVNRTHVRDYPSAIEE